MNVVTVASETVWKNVDKNIELTEYHVNEVMKLLPKTQVILFPELSLTGFIVDESNQEVAQTMDSNAVEKIKAIASKHEVALVCGLVEKNPKGKPFNTQFIVSKDGDLVAKYHKNHLFTQSTEPDVYTPGDELITFELEGWKCGLSTCFDIRFPRLYEAYKKAGVECIFAGFNWVEGRNKVDIIKSLVKARAQENQYFFIVVDRSGSDPNTQYYGTSVISNPFSEDIATRQGVYSYAELDKAEIKEISGLLPLEDSFRAQYKIKQ